MNGSRLRIALIAGLALAATAVIFAGSGAFVHPPSADEPSDGKLSADVVKLESQFKDARALWRANEKAIYAFDKQSFPVLSQVDNQFKALAASVDQLKGSSDAERAALPHLVEAVKTSALIPEVFMLGQINPKAVSAAKLSEAKRDATRANDAWAAWEKASARMTR